MVNYFLFQLFSYILYIEIKNIYYILYMEPNEEARENLDEKVESTPLSKPKKPRSEKQMESFKNAMQKRAENIAKKKKRNC